jgi:hypothetical protein
LHSSISETTTNTITELIKVNEEPARIAITITYREPTKFTKWEWTTYVKLKKTYSFGKILIKQREKIQMVQIDSGFDANNKREKDPFTTNTFLKMLDNGRLEYVLVLGSEQSRLRGIKLICTLTMFR